ncbi:MAG TPA: hypothetical protein VGF94_25795 [Kofleriaceae bacterium]
MYDRAEDLQGQPSAARRLGWLVAAAALACTPAAFADSDAPQSIKPALDHTGWQLDFDTFIQIDSVPWAQLSSDELSPSGAPLNATTMMIRRGLFRVIGHQDDFHTLLEVNANSVGGTPNAQLFEAIAGWSPDRAVDVQAGLMLIPFGAAVPLNARYRIFLEQPTFLQAFFPGDNDAGAQVHGAYGYLRYSIAAMNGAPVKDAQWQGKDPSSSYDFIARVGGEIRLPGVPGRPHVTFGLSALDGSDLDPGTPPTKDQLVWVDENGDGIVQPTELQVIPGSPGEPAGSFDHRALGADARVEWCLREAGQGEAFFEGAVATNLDRGVYYADPVATGRDLRELGWMAGVVQHAGPHAFAGVRYDTYDADRDATSRVGLDLVGAHRIYSTWAVLAAAVRGTARLSVEYDRVRNPFGLSDTGLPTTRADDRVTLRVQAEF